MLENDMYITAIGQAILELLSFKLGSGNHQSIIIIYIYHFSTVIDFQSEKYSGSNLQPLDCNPDKSHLRHPHCKFLYWYQEFLYPVEPLYISDEKSITVEK